MDFIETPAVRFRDLRDYPFAGNFAQVDERGLVMHYVDEGPRGAAPILMLHGEPTWSYKQGDDDVTADEAGPAEHEHAPRRRTGREQQ